MTDLLSGPGGVGDPSPAPRAPALAPSSLLSRPGGIGEVPAAPTLTPKLKGPPGRAIADVGAIRKGVYDNVLSTLSTLGPISAGNYQLQMSDLHYKDPDHFSLRDQKRAILRGETLSRRLDGQITLMTPDGKPVDSRKVTLARVPHLTQQGTFILRGVEYTLSSQQRLRPGIFTRQKENGELESHVNVLPGKGVGHRINLDPESNIFRLEMHQARLPLLPLLRTMGASDKDIQAAWGDEIYNANLKYDDPTVNEKLMRRLVTLKPGEIIGDRKARLRAEFERMELDPEVTMRTLGKPIKNVGMESLVETTKKLIAVNRGEAEIDDRDHAAFQHILGPEDIFAERARTAAKLLRPLIYRSGARGNLDPVQSGALSKMLEGAITQTGLGSALEEVGPADILDQVTRVTRMGVGGIQSTDSIPMEARGVQPSQFGYIDPLRSPESLKIGVDSRFAGSLRKGDNGQIYAPFRDPKSGELVYKSPSEVADSVIAFPGEMGSGRRHVRAVVGGRMRYAPRSSVQLEVPEMEDAFNHLTNLVPGKAWVKGQRVVMASRMLAQALPLSKPEAPLVQSAVPYMNNRSYEEEYGKHMGAVFANTPGVVTAVDPDGVTVKHQDGTTQTYETHNYSPMNRKSVVGTTRIYIKSCGELKVLPIQDYEWKQGDETLSIDPDTKQSAWMPVTGAIRHKNNKRLLQVSTTSGRSVVVTEDHSLMTLGDDGHLTPIYPLDCVIGRTRLPVASLPSITDDTQDRELGELVGLYLSEGHIPSTQPNTILIAVQDEDRAAQVSDLLTRLGYKPYRNGSIVGFSDQLRADYLRSHFGHLAHNKKIPAWVLTSPSVFRTGVVSGYFGGDGCLRAGKKGDIQVVAVSVSRTLRDGIIDLLSTFGVFCTLFDAPQAHLNSNWRDGYGLRVISCHLKRMSRWFFYADREAKFRFLLRPIYKNSVFDAIPVPSKMARQVLYSELSETPSFVYKTAAQGFVAKGRVRSTNGVYGQWGRSDVMWDKVVAIEPVAHEDWVYDLSVAKSEAFAVDAGLVVHNTFLHGTSMVKPGQAVNKGDLLAKSNFTDDKGASALGANFRVAYVPFRSSNFEDAIGISESAAARLESNHMYQRDVEWEDAHKKGRKAFIGLFPAKFDKRQLESVDDDGVVKPGTRLRPGDPIILAARQKERAHNQVSHGRSATWQDAAELWDHESDGVVTDVEKTKRGVVVAIQAASPMKVGDKLSNRSGGKGVVGAIIPDREMPHDAQGRPFEILLNPLGVITRGNPIQTVEAALGKVARITGRPYKIHDFKGQDLVRFALAELAKHGLSDQETISDPTSGRKIPGIMTGESFLMKLHHMAEDKEQGRGLGGYSAEGLPSKSKGASSKRMAMMDVWALLSHGAIGVLQDRAVRGHQDQDLWSAYMRGVTPPNPKVPHTVKKFYDYLRASGINPVQSGSSVRIMGMTDKDVDELAEGRYLENAETVDGGSALKPVRGGLFDQTHTGGHHGRRWSAIKLTEPMPNPILEEPIRRVLGLTEAKFEDVLAGREKYMDRSGPGAIMHALERINLPAAIAETTAQARDGRKTVRDAAVRKLRYLKHAEKLNMHPRDWMMTKVPVLPPMFRPVSIMSQTGQMMVADPNYLYRELWEANENLKHMRERVADPGEERLAVYHAFRAVTGLDAPVNPKTAEKGVKGILEHVFGSSPKYGMVQRKMLSGPMDLVGRAVVAPDSNLDMDQVALPEEQAWSIYTPFIVRKLTRRGVPPVQAAKMVEEKKPEARKALLDEMGERPVWATRAPVLHKFGTMAFWPILSKSNVMKFSPLVNKGFNLDHDGDAMTVHVPFSEAAVKNAIEKMLPSRNLFAPRDFKVHQLPTNEFLAGLFHGTAEINNRNAPRVFKTKADAIKAGRAGEINADSRVVILEDSE